MIEQVAHFHKLAIDLGEHDSRFFRADELGQPESEDVLLRVKMDFSAVAPEVFQLVRNRLDLYAKPRHPLGYKVEIGGQVVDLAISAEGSADSVVDQSVQALGHLKDAFIDDTKTLVASFDKVPGEDRKAICERLETVKNDIGPLLEKLKGVPADDESIRPCHGDLHHGNFLIDGDGKVFLVDFDLSGLNFFYNDIALVLEHMSNRPEYLKEQKDGFEDNLDSAVQKYLEVRPLSISAEVLRDRVRLFRPVMKMFWLKVLTAFIETGNPNFIHFYKNNLLTDYRKVCDAVLQK